MPGPIRSACTREFRGERRIRVAPMRGCPKSTGPGVRSLPDPPESSPPAGSRPNPPARSASTARPDASAATTRPMRSSPCTGPGAGSPPRHPPGVRTSQLARDLRLMDAETAPGAQGHVVGADVRGGVAGVASGVCCHPDGTLIHNSVWNSTSGHEGPIQRAWQTETATSPRSMRRC